MGTYELKPGFYFTGAIDRELQVFDIIMETKYGTTYNSYVLKTANHTVLFETAKLKCIDGWLERVGEITPIEEVDYLVVNHTEPDHSGSIERLLDLNPRIKIVGTPCALTFLKQIVNRDFYSIPVKDGQTLELDDKTLEFILVPNLHWPDTMYTYIREDKSLLTCDSFGAHYATDDVVVSKVKDKAAYRDALRYYFDCIIGPFKSFMLDAIHRVRLLDVDLICTGHGPVLDENIPWMLDTYEEWSTVVNPNPRPTVIIPYVSAYGYTGMLAEAISEGIRASGQVDVRSYDMVTADQEKVIEEMAYADGLLFGTPTIVGEALKPIWDLVSTMSAVTHKGKTASAFGSYGWSGEGVPHIMERLKQLKFKTMDGFRVRFKPSEADLEKAREFGAAFGELVLGNPLPGQRKAKRKVRCLVCGAVLDEGMDTCPVCGVDSTHFVPLEPEGKKPEVPLPEPPVVEVPKAEPKKGKRRLVKCLVCGAIFDEALDTCPVCGVGRDQFVPVEDEEVAYQNDTQNRYVILGNGCAGVSAAEAIRERDKTGQIFLVSNEGPTYQRPMLTRALLTEMTGEQMELHPAGWYTTRNITQMLGRTVLSIDPERRVVTLNGPEELPYTKLILALGSESFIPPVPGHALDGVVAVRRKADKEKIQTMVKNGCQRAVVVGGGVLGLEAAWELRKGKCEVTVLEGLPSLMSRQLDGPASETLVRQCEKVGVQVRTDAKLVAVEGDERVTGVRLADGTVLPADLVVLSCGVKANTALARAAGLTIERGIVVNGSMETSHPDIYACGDCAQYQGFCRAQWAAAQEQGKVAGACAAGETLTYEPGMPALTFHGMETELFVMGDVGKKPEVNYKTLEIRDDVLGLLERYYFVSEKLSGVILMGSLARMADMTKAIQEKRPFKAFFA